MICYRTTLRHTVKSNFAQLTLAVPVILFFKGFGKVRPRDA